jgi:tRNA A-37 threonylcarbamoyl transferase component Bud32
MKAASSAPAQAAAAASPGWRMFSSDEESPLNRLPHGYTNETDRSGRQVRKRYVGKDAERRCEVEHTCLLTLQGDIPVPTLLGITRPCELTMAFVQGSHGQELIDAGEAPLVLRLSGELLAEVQAVPVDSLDGIPGAGDVLVHGDFGPQNLLIDPETQIVTALLDWEFAHVGGLIEDLAWAEWIVGTHHPNWCDHLAALFDGYGERPA